MLECAQVKRKANFKMSKQLIYSGKAKDIYTTEDENPHYFNLGPGNRLQRCQEGADCGQGSVK